MAVSVRMGRLAVIGVFYRRPLLIPKIAEALRAQTRPPDELHLTCETEEDAEALAAEEWPGEAIVWLLDVPAGGVPPSFCINAALDQTKADYIAYLADDSLPLPTKYERMAAALDAGANAVYCSQDRGKAANYEEWLAGTPSSQIHRADHPEDDPFCKVDMTQVMHRSTALRWTLNPGDRKVGDAVFFRDLVREQGPLQPVDEVLDWHRQMPDGITARW